MRFAFDSWQARDQHTGLRDAWLESQNFLARCDWGALRARCGLCAQETPFRLLSDPENPDVREGLICRRCGCNSRVRAALGLLFEHMAPAPRPPITRMRAALARLGLGVPEPVSAGVPAIYVTEQASPTYVWMQRHLDAVVHGGEFEPDVERRKSLSASLVRMGGRGEIVFRDVTRLDFADGVLDAVVSFDVLEHVPDHTRALAEFARVLRPGGVCVATYPFNDRPRTLVRARFDAAGGIEHLEPPEYHGDPIGGGILCYYHFGWDMLEAWRDAGFRHVEMAMPYSLAAGLPYGMWTLVARR